MLLKILHKILAFFAKRVLKKYKPTIVGITGSVGKSSTKEAIYTALKDHMNVRRSLKNYNNEIGVPLTILNMSSPGKKLIGWLRVFWMAIGIKIFPDKSYPEVLALEMAADRPKDIKYLTKLATPNQGVVTAISHAHTEFLGSLENIAKEKQLIVTCLPASGWAILNADDERVMGMKEKTSAKVITFGTSRQADVRALRIEFEQELKGDNVQIKGLRFKVTHAGSVVPVFLPNVIAKTQVYAILAAVATGITFNLNLIEISEALRDYTPLHGRMVPIPGIKKTLIIDDTYNSSPKSAESALKVLQEIKIRSGGRKWTVLGDMRELGNLSQDAHYDLGKRVVSMGFDMLITVGQEAEEIAHAAHHAGMLKSAIESFETSDGVSQFLKSQVRKGDVLLIKGSQAVRMEKIVKGIMLRPHQAKRLLTRQTDEWL